jgi:CubicO group peptidase (beta-lactamase class C family)
VCQHFDEWDCDETSDLRRQITIRHLMTLTSGLDWNEDWSDMSNWRSNDAIRMDSAPDRVQYVLDKPGRHEPGTMFIYSTGDPALLSGVIESATGMTAYEYAVENLFEPMGVGIQWNVDDAGHTTTYAGVQATLREYAQFGYLYLNGGLWEGEQLVPEDWIEVSTRTDTSVNGWAGYGLLWHVNLPVRLNAPLSSIPADGYMAEGIFCQQIFIIPSKGLVVARLSGDSDKVFGCPGEANEVDLLELVLDAITDQGNKTEHYGKPQ